MTKKKQKSYKCPECKQLLFYMKIEKKWTCPTCLEEVLDYLIQIIEKWESLHFDINK